MMRQRETSTIEVALIPFSPPEIVRPMTLLPCALVPNSSTDVPVQPDMPLQVPLATPLITVWATSEVSPARM